jgi:hypothetical protein
MSRAARFVVAAVMVAAPACAGSRTPTAAPSPPDTGNGAVVPLGTQGGRSLVETLLPPLIGRKRPDIVIVAGRPLTAEQQRRLCKLAAPGGCELVRVGNVRLGKTKVEAIAVDPNRFRAYTPAGTAEATQVWQAVARGEAVAAHAVAKKLHLQLGGTVTATREHAVPLRLAAYATTGLPDVGLVVSNSVGAAIGLPRANGLVLSSGKGDPTALAEQVRRIAGNSAHIALLTQPAANPTAFLTGSNAAKAFGAFSYRYFPDGTIEPDARWVNENIVYGRVPILGSVRCHRLMIPQLRSALAEVEARGLASKIIPGQYGGCYVPRFIEHNPNGSVSLHTWGIAIDLNVPGNLRGTTGQIDREVVAIFKRWGFRWGGDWSYTDPMHFELGALLK